jgi:hypothetical protein
MAAEATTGRWQMHDVVTAGEAIISELEIISARPASMPALLLVEYAAGLWDGLAAHLFDDWKHYEGVPEEMGERVRRVHLHLCEQLRPDPGELTERLDRIISGAEAVSSPASTPRTTTSPSAGNAIAVPSASADRWALQPHPSDPDFALGVGVRGVS